MSQKHQKRFFLILFLIFGISTTLALILYALSQNINLFYTPTQLSAQNLNNKVIRVGGMVMANSLHTDPELNNTFLITDYQHELKVYYKGILPDLFKEGQGVVIKGQRINSVEFKATQVLAKHDENYMPPEIKSLVMSQQKGDPT